MYIRHQVDVVWIAKVNLKKFHIRIFILQLMILNRYLLILLYANFVIFQVFSDVIVRDGECVCVELVVKDRYRQWESVVFLGSIRYEVLKQVYDARVLQIF